MRVASLVLALVAACLFAAPAAAQPGYQPPDLAAQRAAVERLSGLVGTWQGAATVYGQQQLTVYQTERVERDLDGLLIVVHGVGHATAERTGAPVFQAYAVLSYDDRAQRYEFRTYTGGHATTATAQILPSGDLQWGFDAGVMRMRYTIRFDATTWHEVGEMSRDGGVTWTRTVELNLRRVS